MKADLSKNPAIFSAPGFANNDRVKLKIALAAEKGEGKLEEGIYYVVGSDGAFFKLSKYKPSTSSDNPTPIAGKGPLTSFTLTKKPSTDIEGKWSDAFKDLEKPSNPLTAHIEMGQSIANLINKLCGASSENALILGDDTTTIKNAAGLPYIVPFVEAPLIAALAGVTLPPVPSLAINTALATGIPTCVSSPTGQIAIITGSMVTPPYGDSTFQAGIALPLPTNLAGSLVLNPSLTEVFLGADGASKDPDILGKALYQLMKSLKFTVTGTGPAPGNVPIVIPSVGVKFLEVPYPG